MKTLPEVEQSNDDQFHAFMGLFLNSYKEMRGKISKAGLQKLIGDKERLTNEVILFLNNSGMTGSGHVFDLTEPIFIPKHDNEISYQATYFKPQGEYVWQPEHIGLPIAGTNFNDLIQRNSRGRYLDLNELRSTTYSFSKYKTFSNDCLIDHLIFDFRHLIPEEWDFPIIAIGTGYTKSPYPNEFWYKMLVPDYSKNWCWEFVHEKLYLNNEIRLGRRKFEFSDVRIMMF